MSRLFERMAVPCAIVSRAEAPDGEGGRAVSWEDGEEFPAAVVHDSSSEARVAERDGAVSGYTITCARDLRFGDVVRRLSDGRCFRVTSDAADGAAPACATFAFNQCSAVEWELPDA